VPLQARVVGAADFVQIGEVLKAPGGLLGVDEVRFAEIAPCPEIADLTLV
jgi:hypothetical protein